MIGRTNTGGGGGLQDTDALLRVQAPAGSVVTITKGGMTKTDHGHENVDDNSVYDYYFIIHQSQFDSVNPWTVTATLGTDTDSDTIIIDTADEYDVELSYFTYLYKDGDLCTAITGGWSGGYANLSNNFTLASDKISIGSATAVGSTNKVDVTNYSKLVFVGKGLTHTGSQPCIAWVGLYSSKSNNAAVATVYKDDAGDFTLEVDLSSYNTSYYITCRAGNGSTAEFYQVYLVE